MRHAELRLTLGSVVRDLIAASARGTLGRDREPAMNHWLVMFRPETYAKVREHGMIGVNGAQEKRIRDIAEGDTFVVYVSRDRLLDGHGVFTSTAFADTTPVFGSADVYPYRARVRFEQSGARKDARDLLWGLEEFAAGNIRTTPANMLFCRGGFMRITAKDHAWLSSVLDGTWVPPEPAV
jgi:hypothetical protein